MNRGILAVLGALVTTLIAQPQAAAGPLILAKDAAGHITPNAVSLELKSNPSCDQSAPVIPDGSKLFSDKFALNVDDKGIGFFNGPAAIVGTDGKPLVVGVLHGTVGLTAGAADATKTCYLPGHLEGMLSGMLAPPPGTTPPGTDPNGVVTAPLELNFQADLVQESAGIVPLYRARLVGLLPPMPPPPPPPTGNITIVPGKPEFSANESVIAVIANGSTQDIQVFDEQSYCSIVQLQRQVGTDWTMVAGCPLLRIPLPRVIKAGTTIKVLLPEVAIPEFMQIPGVYRMVIDWQNVDAGGKGVGVFTKAISPLFKVVAPPPPTPQLKVMADKPAYAPADTITAIIANGPLPVRILDEQSLCTIVQLQRFDGTNWVLEGGCPLDRMPIATILKAGEMVKVPLTRSAPWVVGRYRLAVTFAPVDSTGQPTAPDQTAFSEPFAVPAPPTVPPVTITPDRRSYTLTQPIIATISNGAPFDVLTWDHRSFCTVVNLQKQVTGAWRTVAPCLLMTPSMPVIIKAGQKLVVRLPGATATDTAKWEPGVYRLQADFGLATGPISSSIAFEVVSDPFTVAPGTVGIAPQTMEMTPQFIR